MCPDRRRTWRTAAACPRTWPPWQRKPPHLRGCRGMRCPLVAAKGVGPTPTSHPLTRLRIAVACEPRIGGSAAFERHQRVDTSGRPFWPPTPPPAPHHAHHQHSPLLHPFYYTPMQLEEPPPVMGSALRLTHSVSQQSRMVRSASPRMMHMPPMSLCCQFTRKCKLFGKS